MKKIRKIRILDLWFLDSGRPNEAAAMRPYVKLL